MAVTTQYSVEFDKVEVDVPPVRLHTSEWHGRVRSCYVSHVQSGAGDAASSVALMRLPAGRVRLLLPMCHLYVNWTTASATLDLGWDAYTDLDGAAVAADPDGLIDGLDVDTAGVYGFEELTAAVGTGAPATTGYEKSFASKGGVIIRATSQDVALADASALYGRLFYVQD